VGFPALRLGGLYLALTTFALAVAVPQILKHKAVEAWTGGVQGLFLLNPEAPAWLALSPDQYRYVVALLVAGLCYLLTANLLRGRIGRAMMAVRDNPTAAEAMGMDLASLKAALVAIARLEGASPPALELAA
jgi:branched-chain amino acid transport system permease protein